jgi:Trypsin-like peptidase domain
VVYNFILLSVIYIAQLFTFPRTQIIDDNFPKIKFDSSLLYVSLPLQCKYKGVAETRATGFIISAGNKYFLITNYHVLTGRDPATNEKEQPTWPAPDVVEVWFRDSKLKDWKRQEYALYIDSNPLYKGFFASNGRMDLATLEINLPTGINVKILTTSNIDTRGNSVLDNELWICGYPMGQFNIAKPPIVVKGLQESPAKHNHPLTDNVHIFYNVGSQNGMSGSPIYSYNRTANKFMLIGINSQRVDLKNSSGSYGDGIYTSWLYEPLNSVK